jgi:hypothetical protein
MSPVDACLKRFRVSINSGWIHLDAAIENEAAMAFGRRTGWRLCDALRGLSYCSLETPERLRQRESRATNSITLLS